jgi:hypothetical protein
MAIGLAIGIVAGLVSGLVTGVAAGLLPGLLVGPAAGLLTGLIAGFAISQAWPTALTAAQLARRWHTPLHLRDFLEDARERNVLRTAGPAYQFRHARLQDRLAATATSERDNSRANQPSC